MRRKDREITGLENLTAVMEQCSVCRLALNGEDGWPYVVPLNFGFTVRAGRVELYFHGAMEGTKNRLMARDNRAAFEMDRAGELVTDPDRGSCTMRYESIMGRGHIEEIPDEDREEALNILLAHYYLENFPYNPAMAKRTKVYKLVVEELTGKANRRPVRRNHTEEDEA